MTLHKVYLKGITFELVNPEVDLWTLKQIHRVSTWPKLPIGLRNAMLTCEYHLVKPWEKDVYKCYIVIRTSNNRVVKFNRRFYTNELK